MGNNNSRTAPSDALVIFAVIGDLAHKKIFPALHSMVKRGVLNVPLVGVVTSRLSPVRIPIHISRILTCHP